VVAACAGLYHSLALTRAAEVYAWGWANLNQVGDRDPGSDCVTIPRLIKLSESPAVWIMAGCYQSAASLANGYYQTLSIPFLHSLFHSFPSPLLPPPSSFLLPPSPLPSDTL
jgi:hypothetical protein